MKEINILEATIFSSYFAEFINKDGKYTVTKKFMEDNIFITGMCECGEPFCGTVYLITKKSLEKSRGQIKSNQFINRCIFLHVENDFLEFEGLDDEITSLYKGEITKLLK